MSVERLQPVQDPLDRYNKQLELKLVEKNKQIPGARFSRTLTEKQIGQLVEFSTIGDKNGAEAIHKNTSDNDRFHDEDAVKDWLKKGRSFITLTNDEGDLLGICWLGKSKMKTEGKKFLEGFDEDEAYHYGITYAIRTYGDARGAGVSNLLTQAAMEEFEETEEFGELQKHNQHHKWLEVEIDNHAGIKSYERSGCVPVTEPYQTIDEDGTEHTKITMVFTDREPAKSQEHLLFLAA